MSQFDITVEGGTSVRLPTAGKYCPKNILITATGGGGGGENLDAVIAEQADLIAELSAVLDEKSSGGDNTGGGGGEDTNKEWVLDVFSEYWVEYANLSISDGCLRCDYDTFSIYEDGEYFAFIDGYGASPLDLSRLNTTKTYYVKYEGETVATIVYKEVSSGGDGSGSGYHYYFDDADWMWFETDLPDSAFNSIGYCPSCSCKLSESNLGGFTLNTTCPYCGAAIRYLDGNVTLS